MGNEQEYTIQEEGGYIYRNLSIESSEGSYTERVLLGPAKTAKLSVEPDTVRWATPEVIFVKMSITVWNGKSMSFELVSELPKLAHVELSVQLQGRRSPLIPSNVLPEVKEGSAKLDLVGILGELLGRESTPSLLLEISTAIEGYANMPATVAIV